MDEFDFKKVEKIVFISSLVLATIGVVEIAVGHRTNSIGLVADGLDSISDSAVSAFVGLGLRISRRRPDKRFQFGYYRVETLASMAVAVVMLAMSAVIFYNAYNRLLNPVEISYPWMGMLTLAGAGISSITMAVLKNRIAGKYSLLSLKADAKNSIKDGSASFIVLAGVFLSTLGFAWGDPLGAMVVGVYIVFVARTTLKQASLVLIDAFNNTEMVADIAGIVKNYPMVKLKDLRLRLAGPYIVGEMIVGVNKDMSVGELFRIKEKIKLEVKKEIADMKELLVSAEPVDAKHAREYFSPYDYEYHGNSESPAAKALKTLTNIERHVRLSKPKRD